MDDYEYVRTLRGAIYGKVALVRHRRSSALYAIKMMSLAHMRARRAVAGAHVCEDGDAELRILRQLSGCRISCSEEAERVATDSSSDYHTSKLEPSVSPSTTTSSVRPQYDARHNSSNDTNDNGSTSINDDHSNVLLLQRDFVDVRTQTRCLVFDYCPFGELFELVAPGRAPASRETARSVFEQLARAVQFLHRRNVAHRDISLENVLVDAQHACRLADFGLATDTGAMCSGRVGKALYMAPEVRASSSGPPQSHVANCYDGLAADIWSLGVVLFILVTGVPPFEQAAETDARFRLVRSRGVSALLTLWQLEHCVDVTLCDLLTRMLCVDARARIAIDDVWLHPWVRGGRVDSAANTVATVLESSEPSPSAEQQQPQVDTEKTISTSTSDSSSNEPEPHDDVARSSVCIDDDGNGDTVQSKSHRYHMRKRMKISTAAEPMLPSLHTLRSSSNGDSPAWHQHSTISYDYSDAAAPALAREQSLWASRGTTTTRQELSALFAPYSTPTAGRGLDNRSVCFTPSNAQTRSDTNYGADGCKQQFTYDQRRRRTSLSLARTAMSHAAAQTERLMQSQSHAPPPLRCRFCHYELERECSAGDDATADAPATTLCMCECCFSALPLTAPLATRASSVLVLRKVGASAASSLPAQSLPLLPLPPPRLLDVPLVDALLPIAAAPDYDDGCVTQQEAMAHYWDEICLFGAGHCFYPRSAAASSVYCYALALAYTVSVSIQRARLGEHGHATHLLPVKRMRWFPTFLACSYVARIAWFLLSNTHAFEWVVGTTAPPYRYEHMIIDVPILPTDIDIYVLGVTSCGKLATLLYFSAFTLLLRFWEDVLRQAQRAEQPLARFAATNQSVIAEYTRASQQQQLRSRKLFVVANVWIYLVESALLALKTLFPTTYATNSLVFQLDYGIVALFFFVLAAMLARCAIALYRVLRKIEFSALAAKLARRIAVLGAAVAIVFLYRSVLLLIAMPAIDVFDPHGANPWLFYTVPEIVPGVLVISMMSVKKSQGVGAGATGASCLPTVVARGSSIDEATPLLERRFSTDPPRFQGQELHI